MKGFILGILSLSVGAWATGNVGLPSPFLCQNTGTGEFLYSIRVTAETGISKAVVTNEKAITSLAKKINLIEATDPTVFKSVEVLSTQASCSTNKTNPFAMRCHPKLELFFAKRDTPEIVKASVNFASVWNVRHVHETPFTTWDEYEVRIGASNAAGGYVSEVFKIDHPKCVPIN